MEKQVKNIHIKGDNIFSILCGIYLNKYLNGINIYIDYFERDNLNTCELLTDEIIDLFQILKYHSVSNFEYIGFHNKKSFKLDLSKDNIFCLEYNELKEIILNKEIKNLNNTPCLNHNDTFTITFKNTSNFDSTLSPAIKNKYSILFKNSSKNNYNTIIKHKDYCIINDQLNTILLFEEYFMEQAYDMIDNNYYNLIKYNNKFNSKPCTIQNLNFVRLNYFIEPLINLNTIVFFTMFKSFCEFLNQKQNLIDYNFTYFFNIKYQLLIHNIITFLESFYCLNDSINFKWYLNKLHIFGWPFFFGDKTRFDLFKYFDKENYLIDTKTRIYNEKDYIIIKDSL